jgi:hypothetical protein
MWQCWSDTCRRLCVAPPTVTQITRRFVKLASIGRGNDPGVIKEKVATLGEEYTFVDSNAEHGFFVLAMVRGSLMWLAS